jgi:hypothetical protein
LLNKTIAATGVAAALFCTPDFADERTAIADKTFEIGVGIHGDSEGSGGDDLHSNSGMLLQAGYRFAPHWSVTGIYTYAGSVGIENRAESTDIHRLYADIGYDFTPEEVYSFYVLAAAGYEFFTDTPQERDGFFSGFGGGLRFNVSETIGINLAALLKYNLEHTDTATLWHAAVNYRF